MSTTKKLLLMGGGDCDFLSYEWFVEAATQKIIEGGGTLQIMGIPWASVRTNEELNQDWIEWGTAKGEGGESILSAISLCGFAPPASELIADPQLLVSFMEKLSNATHGLFFFGGDQSKIMNLLENPACVGLQTLFLELYHSGKCAIAGTSAGAAVMSKTMLTGECVPPSADGTWSFIESQGRVETRQGLGVLQNVIVDQHFLRRSRMNRLLSVLLASREQYAIGVDEDVACSVEDNTALNVFGKEGSIVTLFERVVDAQQVSTFVIRILNVGQRFNLTYNI